jgi:hypothetical protein
LLQLLKSQPTRLRCAEWREAEDVLGCKLREVSAFERRQISEQLSDSNQSAALGGANGQASQFSKKTVLGTKCFMGNISDYVAAAVCSM